MRLGREAWVDAGLGAAAAEVVARGAAAGLFTEPVAAPRSSPIVVAGLCEVNDFVTSLRVHIIGWIAARRAICTPAPAPLVKKQDDSIAAKALGTLGGVFGKALAPVVDAAGTAASQAAAAAGDALKEKFDEAQREAEARRAV